MHQSIPTLTPGLCLGELQGGHLQLTACLSSLQLSITQRPQLCLALGQLWVLSSRKEAVAEKEEEEEEQEEGSDEDGTSIILIRPTCSATSGLVVVPHPTVGQEGFPAMHTPPWEWPLPPRAGSGWGHFHVLNPHVTFWFPAGKGRSCCSGSSEGAMAWAAPPSCPRHGAVSCPCVLPHRSGLCRHICPWAGGPAGPATGSPLFLQLLGTEGAVGGNTTGVSWEMLQEQPDSGTQLPGWAEVPLWLGAAVRQSCLRREERQLGAYPPVSLSLPTAQDKGSLKEPFCQACNPWRRS